MQQLPKKAGKYIRGCIVGKPRHCLISADYAGQEIRILAAYTRDEHLIRAYNPCYHCDHNKEGNGTDRVINCPFENHNEGSECNTVDIHSYITKQVYSDVIDVPVEQIKNVPQFNKMRSICKSVTFGLAYGGTEYGLSRSTNIPLSEAKEVLDKYFMTFPKIKNFIKKCQLYVDQHGEIMDMVGRVRKFQYAGWMDSEKADFYEPDGGESTEYFHRPSQRYSAEVKTDRRAGTNFPVQGLAASMTKIAAAAINERFRAEGLDAVIIQFIHDEVLVHCLKDEDTLTRVISIIEDCMVNRIDMPSHCVKDHPCGWSWPAYIPMSVEVEVGDSYGTIMEPEKYIESLRSANKVIFVPKDKKIELLDS